MTTALHLDVVLVMESHQFSTAVPHARCKYYKCVVGVQEDCNLTYMLLYYFDQFLACEVCLPKAKLLRLNKLFKEWVEFGVEYSPKQFVNYRE